MPGRSCVIIGCVPSKRRLLDESICHIDHKFRFPKDPELRELWLNFVRKDRARWVRIETTLTRNDQICRHHFLASDFRDSKARCDIHYLLKRTAVPSISDPFAQKFGEGPIEPQRSKLVTQSTIGFPQGSIYSKNGEPPRKVANLLQILEPTTSTHISRHVSNLPRNAAWSVTNSMNTTNHCSDSTEVGLLKSQLHDCKLENIDVKEEVQEFDPTNYCSVDPSSNSVAAASITKEHEINVDVEIKTELDLLQEEKLICLPGPDCHHCLKNPAQNVPETPSVLAPSEHLSSPSEWSSKTISDGLQNCNGESTDTARETGEEENSYYMASLMSADKQTTPNLSTTLQSSVNRQQPPPTPLGSTVRAPPALARERSEAWLDNKQVPVSNKPRTVLLISKVCWERLGFHQLKLQQSRHIRSNVVSHMHKQILPHRSNSIHDHRSRVKWTSEQVPVYTGINCIQSRSSLTVEQASCDKFDESPQVREQLIDTCGLTTGTSNCCHSKRKRGNAGSVPIENRTDVRRSDKQTLGSNVSDGSRIFSPAALPVNSFPLTVPPSNHNLSSEDLSKPHEAAKLYGDQISIPLAKPIRVPAVSSNQSNDVMHIFSHNSSADILQSVHGNYAPLLRSGYLNIVDSSHTIPETQKNLHDCYMMLTERVCGYTKPDTASKNKYDTSRRSFNSESKENVSLNTSVNRNKNVHARGGHSSKKSYEMTAECSKSCNYSLDLYSTEAKNSINSYSSLKSCKKVATNSEIDISLLNSDKETTDSLGRCISSLESYHDPLERSKSGVQSIKSYNKTAAIYKSNISGSYKEPVEPSRSYIPSTEFQKDSAENSKSSISSSEFYMEPSDFFKSSMLSIESHEKPDISLKSSNLLKYSNVAAESSKRCNSSFELINELAEGLKLEHSITSSDCLLRPIVSAKTIQTASKDNSCASSVPSFPQDNFVGESVVNDDVTLESAENIGAVDAILGMEWSDMLELPASFDEVKFEDHCPVGIQAHPDQESSTNGSCSPLGEETSRRRVAVAPFADDVRVEQSMNKRQLCTVDEINLIEALERRVELLRRSLTADEQQSLGSNQSSAVTSPVRVNEIRLRRGDVLPSLLPKNHQQCLPRKLKSCRKRYHMFGKERPPPLHADKHVSNRAPSKFLSKNFYDCNATHSESQYEYYRQSLTPRSISSIAKVCIRRTSKRLSLGKA